MCIVQVLRRERGVLKKDLASKRIYKQLSFIPYRISPLAITCAEASPSIVSKRTLQHHSLVVARRALLDTPLVAIVFPLVARAVLLWFVVYQCQL